MNFLFDNPITNMPGPIFLVLYGSVIFFSAIAFYLFKTTLDWTDKQPSPIIPHQPDPFEIAYLRGGENELARSVIFSLTQKGFLKITTDGKKSFISYADNQPNWTTLPQIERTALTWFQSIRETGEVFGNFGLTGILKPFAVIFDQKIKQENLLTPDDVKVKARTYSLLIFVLIALLGGYKLISAIIHGRSNFIFLIIFTVIAFVAFWFLGKVKRLSKKGTKYVESLQDAFSKLRENPTYFYKNPMPNSPAFNSVDPLLLAMGVFGTSALIGNGYSDFEQAFHRSSSGYYGGGSCGSSCGSSCSSGGDGGSSCGGGGCGGCGGGGCGS